MADRLLSIVIVTLWQHTVKIVEVIQKFKQMFESQVVSICKMEKFAVGMFLLDTIITGKMKWVATL